MSGDPSLGVYAALRRYSNVHRGTGHHSILSTELFERARGIVREHVNAGPDHVVLLVTPWKLDGLLGSLKPQTAVQVVSSAELGLAVGVRAVVVRRADLPTGIPPQTGGGTIKMVSRDFISWADAPDRFEPGTPNIIGTIALAHALRVPTEAGPQDPATARSAEDILYRDGLGDRSGAALLTALQETLIGRDAVVATTLGERRYVNLDNGASTPTFEPVWDAFRWTLEADPAVQADVVREVASRCHAFFGAPEADYDLLFASNTTEAVNIAMQNLVRTAEEQPGTVVMNTWMEHNSNELPWRHSGVEQVRVPVDRDGQIDLEEMERMLAAYNISHAHGDRRIRLVSVCGASNVMGTYADIPAIGRLVRNYDAQLMVDAAQLSAHRPIDMARDGVDFLAFSAHKMYAPFGSGGLVARRDRLRLDDETLERIRQSGAENAAGVAAGREGRQRW